MSHFGSNLRHIEDVVFISALNNRLFVRQYVLMRYVLSSSQMFPITFKPREIVLKVMVHFVWALVAITSRVALTSIIQGLDDVSEMYLDLDMGCCSALLSVLPAIIMGKSSKLNRGDLQFVLSFPGGVSSSDVRRRTRVGF